jgi:hypothetical protein
MAGAARALRWIHLRGSVVIIAAVALVTTAKVHSREEDNKPVGLPEFESEV